MHAGSMARVEFRRRAPSLSVEVGAGQSVLDAARRAGLPMASACGGEGVCKACRVEVLAGAEHLSPADARERRALERAGGAPDERLACRACVLGDVLVTTPYW
jgi:2Fe-2S ferredoxin